MKSFLQKIFSIKNIDNKKVITLLGVKIKHQTFRQFVKQQLVELSYVLEKDIQTAYIHQKVFPKYKNINAGKTVVLCGAGPSLNKYEPIKDAVHVALNRACNFNKVKFDYLFAQDWKGIYNIIEDIISYEGNNCIKFIGTQNDFEKEEIPESEIAKFQCERYVTDLHRWSFCNEHHFTKDLSTQPLGNFGTIAFPAMQFVLWTNPEKIYLAGCDSAPVGHFSGEILEANKRALNDNTYSKIINQWKELKKFADFHYPGTEIISINPVGLKGIFKDIYTE